jgi:hypothetical protein
LLPKVSQVSLTAAKVRHTKHQAKDMLWFINLKRFIGLLLSPKNMQKKIDKRKDER